MLFLFFADVDTSIWLPVVGTGVFGIIGIIVTYFLARPKTNADAAHILAQTNSILATRLKAATEELDEIAKNIPQWKQALEHAEKKSDELGDKCEQWESCLSDKQAEIDRLTAELERARHSEPLGPATISHLTALAEGIVENIGHIYFVPADDNPSESDVGYIRRFKEIRSSCKQILETLKNEA